MMKSQRHCVIMGLCFAPELGYLLRISEDFDRDFTLTTLVAYENKNMANNFRLSDEEIQRTSVLIHHPLIWTRWDQREFAHVLSRFSKEVQVITFPYPVFNVLWPSYFLDPRFMTTASAQSNDDNNKMLYAYGDFHVLRLKKQGMASTEIVEEYRKMDVPSNVDLNRMFDHTIESQRPKEAETDVKVLDFIADRYKNDRLFLCVNHGSNQLLILMANQILARLGYKPLPRYAGEALRELMDPEIPIHPSIIKFFDLPYVTPDTRYRIDRRILNWEEYIYFLAKDQNIKTIAPEVIIAKQQEVRRRMESIRARFNDPSLAWIEIVDVSHAFSEAFPNETFPPDLEKKSLELTLDCYPDRDDLRRRLVVVESQLKPTSRPRKFMNFAKLLSRR